jgi:hypothetical protein
MVRVALSVSLSNAKGGGEKGHAADKNFSGEAPAETSPRSATPRSGCLLGLSLDAP